MCFGNFRWDYLFFDGVGVALTAEAAGGSLQGKATYSYTFEEGTVGESHSIVVSFAHTVNFPEPTDGTLSVSRGDEALTSGIIVRDGEILTITAIPDGGHVLAGIDLGGVPFEPIGVNIGGYRDGNGELTMADALLIVQIILKAA